MNTFDGSQFRLYSWGIVADNKPLTSKVINVVPIEVASMIDGELASNPTEIKSEGLDKQGQKYNVSVTTDNVIEATWLPFGSNRVTAPDVRRGESVLIYQYGSVDKFYWKETGLGEDLRRLETVVYAFNANPNTNSKDFDPADCYFLEVSTHAKQITLHTSNANGEPFIYAFQFNCKDGKVLLSDDTKNFFELDSKNLTMKMELNTGTKVHLDNMKLLLEGMHEAKIKCGSTEWTLSPSGTIFKSATVKGKN